MHLVNSTDGGGGADSHETGRGLTPRLERKKVSIKRDDLIKSAEGALAACSGHRAMLEVRHFSIFEILKSFEIFKIRNLCIAGVVRGRGRHRVRSHSRILLCHLEGTPIG